MNDDEQPQRFSPPPQIFYNDKDITDLVARARRAIALIENLRIVGATVSGDPRNGFKID